MSTINEFSIEGLAFAEYENKFYHKHSIKKKDNLSKICSIYGYDSMDDVTKFYNLEINSKFKSKFPDMAKIDYIDAPPFYIPVKETKKQKVNEYVQTSLPIIVFKAKSASKEPFSNYKLTKPVTVAFHLDFTGKENSTIDELESDGEFTFNGNNEFQEIISPSEWGKLKGIFIWVKEKGCGSFINKAGNSAVGRINIKKGNIKENKNKKEVQFELLKGVVQFIVDEVKINEKDPEITKIKNWVEQSQATTDSKEKKELFNNAENLWIHKVHKNEDFAGLVQSVRYLGGGEWDYKPVIRKVWGTDNRLGNTIIVIYYDIWANLNYGYMGKKAGFDKAYLIAGANKAQNFDEGKYDPIDDTFTQEAYDLSFFTIESVLNIIERNKEYYSRSGRELFWKDSSNSLARTYILKEFSKRGIPYPKGFK